VVGPVGYADDGSPIFERLIPPDAGGAYNFNLVVEGRPDPALQCGASSCMGDSTFAWTPSEPTALPDLQIEASNNLGDGSAVVCDDSGANAGGIPAADPFDFSADYAPKINDFSCRFKNGMNAYYGIVDPVLACTKLLPLENYQFAGVGTKVQFCGKVSQSLSFPIGDTVLAARVRDAYGNISAVSTIVVRVVAQ